MQTSVLCGASARPQAKVDGGESLVRRRPATLWVTALCKPAVLAICLASWSVVEGVFERNPTTRTHTHHNSTPPRFVPSAVASPW
jgi:hypothetical protein